MGIWSKIFGKTERNDAKPAPKFSPIPLPRFDNWQNVYSGLGTDRDPTTQGTYWAPYRIQDTELLALYNGSDLAARVVDVKPREMMKRGYEISINGEEEADDEELETLQKAGAKLRLDELVTEGGTWGNLFGGSLLIIGAQDGLTPDKPLNEKNISTIRYLNVIDRRFIYVNSYYSNPLEPNYGLPETYLVTNTVSGMGAAQSAVVIHETRCIRFDGAKTDILTRQQLSGWSWSTLQRAYEPIRNFENAFQSVGNLMNDASQAVFKMEGLLSMLASGEKENLQTRMALVDQSKSTCRAVLLDAEKEEFERVAVSFAGISDVLDRFMQRLSATCQIPVTILFGRSAAGLNATGDSDFRAFYDSLGAAQENELAPKLRRLYHILAIAKDSVFRGQDMEFKIKFHALWTPTDKEQAEVKYQIAQADNIYITAGVLTAQQVAKSRFGKGTYSTETEVDNDEIDRDAQDERMFGNMLNPPPELANRGQDTGGQEVPGQQQTGVTALPGPQTQAGAAASPFGSTNNPVKVMANLHKPLGPDGQPLKGRSK